MNIYYAYNAKGEILRRIIAKNIESAAAKVKVMYGENRFFVRLKYVKPFTFKEVKKNVSNTQ